MTPDYSSVILIVDDKPANMLVLESLLTSENRVLLKAMNGKEALQVALNNDIDLMILDVQMPDMNGFEVAQILKTNKRTKDIPIIFATAESKERKLMMKGYDEGAVDYLLKPMDPDVVKAKVDVLLKIQLQKKELVEKNISLEKRDLLINNSLDIIGILDAETFIIEDINQAFATITGFSVEEAKGKSLTNFLHLPTIENKGADIIHFQTKIKCKDETVKWLEWKITVNNGKWYTNARDITEVIQLHTKLQNNLHQLEISNKELESFSYSVSHDLRAPLRALNGYSQMIEEDYSHVLDDEGVRLLGNIRNNAKKMGMLIDDLLAFSRLGKKEVQKADIDTRSMIEHIVADISHNSKHHASIEVDTLPSSYADHTLLQQVWINLIANAIKYSSKKEKPLIHISSIDNPDETVFYIKDNGCGFDMKYADKLFGVFQRLHSPSEFEGTGVGLAIVHRIISKHGGIIKVDAKPDDGATFYFSLPKKM